MSLGFLRGFLGVSLRSLHKTSAPPRPLNNALHLQDISPGPATLSQHYVASSASQESNPATPCVAASQRQQRRSVDPASQRRNANSVAASLPRRSVVASQRRSRVAASQRQQRRSVAPASQRRSVAASQRQRVNSAAMSLAQRQRRSVTAPPAPGSVAASQRRSATRPQERHSATSETHVSAPFAPPLRIPDLRRSMMFLVFMMRLSGPVKVFKEEVESHIGHVLRLGWIRQGQYWTSCQGNSEFSDLFNFAFFVAAICLEP